MVEIQSLSSVELTRMLKAWGGGDSSALDRLTPVVYADFIALATKKPAARPSG